MKELSMKKTLNKLDSVSDKNIYLITVGLADPTDSENTDHIKERMKSQLSKEVFEKAHIFHLRGGIDYSKLDFSSLEPIIQEVIRDD